MLGERVCVLLIKSFEDVFDVKFTARLEEELDEIEEGKMPWRESVREFWEKFIVDLDKAGDEMVSYKAGIPTGKKCEKCGQGELLERISRHGFFLGCSRYPECDFIQDMSEEIAVDAENKIEYCENCGKEMAHKARAVWGVPGMQRLSRLQNHAPPDGWDEDCAATRRTIGREVHALWKWIDQEARAVWRFHRLFRVSEVQVYAGDYAGN